MRTPRRQVPRWPLAVEDRVWFEGEGRPYRVRAVSADGRWVICTKPHNLAHTVLYSIIDFEGGVRGPDDRVFSRGYESGEDVVANLNDLIAGELAVSVRYDAPLHIVRARRGQRRRAVELEPHVWVRVAMVPILGEKLGRTALDGNVGKVINVWHADESGATRARVVSARVDPDGTGSLELEVPAGTPVLSLRPRLEPVALFRQRNGLPPMATT